MVPAESEGSSTTAHHEPDPGSGRSGIQDPGQATPLPGSVGAGTLAELDGLLARAASEVQQIGRAHV